MEMIEKDILIFVCLEEKISHRFAGYILINQYPNEESGAVTLGASLVPEYQHKGLGTEAAKMKQTARNILRWICKEISFNPAVELSYLKPEGQEQFLEVMDWVQAAPSLPQTQRMKKLCQEGTLIFLYMSR